MLAATGARGLRLVGETEAFSGYEFSEANPVAAEVLERNVHESGRPGLVVHSTDARVPPDERAFDYVDLDPFGTPAPFVEAALLALRPGGVLAVTATDMPVLTGVARGVCERRYGARPIRGSQGPEGGLRILIAYLIRCATARAIELRPALGYIHDHYVRVYLKWAGSDPRSTGPDGVGDPGTLGESAPPIQGAGPFGPMWLGPLFDPTVVSGLRTPETAARPEDVGAFVERIREEARVDVPFYYEPNSIASELRLPEPPSLATLLDGLRSRGFAAARSHARPSAFRTTAPRAAVFETARGGPARA